MNNTLSLCPLVKDGWTYDFVEDLTLTPTPRDNVDWSLLPDDIIKIILNFVDESQKDYWSEITKQRTRIPMLIETEEQKRLLRYHYHKKTILKNIDLHMPKNHLELNSALRLNRKKYPTKMSLIKRIIDYNSIQELRGVERMIKRNTIKNKKKSVKSERNKKKQRCSVCGKLGHNKNNRKYH